MAKKAKPAPSFDRDIRPLFDKRAVDQMKSIAGFDLSKLQDVRKHAGKIFFRLSTKSMPPEKPWPDARIAKFKEWPAVSSARLTCAPSTGTRARRSQV